MPIVYALISYVGAYWLAWLLGALFVVVAALLIIEGVREGSVKRDRVIAMLTMFLFNVLFWMFFEQAGSSFNFLAQNIVDRNLFGWEFPTGWFQSVNPLAIVLIAPLVALAWGWMNRRNIEPSIPRKFGLGLIGNALAFLVLMYALKHLVGADNHIPFWPLVACYVLQTLGELCLSPIGLSMVTKLAPLRVVGLSMGGWFLSQAIGNNMSGLAGRQHQRRDGHDGRVGAGRVHVQFLSAVRRGRRAVRDCAVDQQADARRAVAVPLSRLRERAG